MVDTNFHGSGQAFYPYANTNKKRRVYSVLLYGNNEPMEYIRTIRTFQAAAAAMKDNIWTGI